MIITLLELADSKGTDLICVPIGEGKSVPLSTSGKVTLRQFGDMALKAEEEAFPLQIYYMAGNFRRLAIHPKGGQIDVLPEDVVTHKRGNYELSVYRNPLPKEYI